MAMWKTTTTWGLTITIVAKVSIVINFHQDGPNHDRYKLSDMGGAINGSKKAFLGVLSPLINGVYGPLLMTGDRAHFVGVMGPKK